jgi:hypothetical protein
MSILPFSLQLPSGYSLSPGSSGTQATGASSSATAATAAGVKSAAPVDVISIGNSSFVAGDFTAQAGDIYRLSDLFKTTAPAGQTTAGFRVALGDVATGDGGGKLMLDGKAIVPSRTSFSAEEFAQLTYVAGTAGPQSLVVIAQTGSRLTNADGSLGALTHEIDSPAVQITADVTGRRSINAMNALSTTPTGADVEIASIVQQAGIFSGFVGTTRSTLQTALTPEPPMSLSVLADTTGTYQSAGLQPSNSEIDLSSFYSAAIGSSFSPGIFANPNGALATALLLLGGAATGAFQTADNLTAQAQAIRAYNTTKGF